jgi:hypothetical protein
VGISVTVPATVDVRVGVLVAEDVRVDVLVLVGISAGILVDMADGMAAGGAGVLVGVPVGEGVDVVVAIVASTPTAAVFIGGTCGSVTRGTPPSANSQSPTTTAATRANIATAIHHKLRETGNPTFMDFGAGGP